MNNQISSLRKNDEPTGDRQESEDFLELFLKNLLKQLAGGMLQKIIEIHESVGLSQSQQLMRHRAMHDAIKQVVDDLQRSELELKKQKESYLKIQKRGVKTLIKDLSLKRFVLSKNDKLAQKIHALSTKFLELNEMKKERLAQLESDKEKMKMLSARICVPYVEPVFKTAIPSQKELYVFEMNVQWREKKLQQREREFECLSSRIQESMKNLNYQATDELKTLLDNDDDVFSASRMNDLKFLAERLDKLVMESKFRQKKMLKIFQDIWDFLGTDQSVQDEFKQSLVGSCIDIEDKLKAELAEYQQSKDEFIEKMIYDIRSDIVTTLDKIRADSFELPDFFFFDNRAFNDDLLDVHQNILIKLENYEIKYKPVFAAIRDYETAMLAALSLEKKINDPNKYRKFSFEQLLTADREHRFESKKMNSLKDKTLDCINKIESSSGPKFEQYGFIIQNYFAEMEQVYKLRVKNIKNRFSISRHRPVDANKTSKKSARKAPWRPMTIPRGPVLRTQTRAESAARISRESENLPERSSKNCSKFL